MKFFEPLESLPRLLPQPITLWIILRWGLFSSSLGPNYKKGLLEMTGNDRTMRLF